MSRIANGFVAYSRRKLADYHSQVVRCVELLSPAEVWHRANEHSNSVGNLLLHLRGNVMMWVVAGLGGRPFVRDRLAEFAQREPLATGPMLDGLADALRQADDVLTGLSDEALARSYEIQSYRVSGLEAVYHVTEHFAFHTGQVVTMTKALRNCDLSLYDAAGHRRDGRTSDAP
jgi:uncharacterized damage-inducible protein DinB